jgi:hypothetical protein
MKKKLCFCVLFYLIGSSIVFSEDPKSNRDYLREQLTIEVKYGYFGTYTPNINRLTINQYRYWTFYQGFSMIDEPTFLTLTGFPNEAEEAQRFKNVNDILNISAATTAISGGLLLTTGLVAILISMSYEDFMSPEALLWNDIARVSMWTGLGLSTATIIPAIIQMSRGDKWMPLSKAYEIMLLYNREQFERSK